MMIKKLTGVIERHQTPIEEEMEKGVVTSSLYEKAERKHEEGENH
jgi:hypothetical protein